MTEKKVITLDLTGCKYLGELHERIKKAFDFPDFYGENWSAFWDLLSTECDADTVKITGEHTMPGELARHVQTMHEILQRLKDHSDLYGEPFDFKIID